MKAVLWTLWIYSSSHHSAQWHSRLDAFQSVNGTQEGKISAVWVEEYIRLHCFFFFLFQVHMPVFCISLWVMERVSLHNEAQVVPLCNSRNPTSLPESNNGWGLDEQHVAFTHSVLSSLLCKEMLQKSLFYNRAVKAPPRQIRVWKRKSWRIIFSEKDSATRQTWHFRKSSVIQSRRQQ